MPDITPRNASNQSIALVEATTNAANSQEFHIPEGSGYVVFCEVLGAGESVNVQAKDPSGTWITITDDLLQAGAGNNQAAFYSKGVYRVVKSATAASTGVYAFNKSFAQTGNK